MYLARVAIRQQAQAGQVISPCLDDSVMRGRWPVRVRWRIVRFRWYIEHGPGEGCAGHLHGAVNSFRRQEQPLPQPLTLTCSVAHFHHKFAVCDLFAERWFSGLGRPSWSRERQCGRWFGIERGRAGQGYQVLLYPF